MNSIDSQTLLLIAVFIAAALPTAIYLTFRLKNNIDALNSQVTNLHLRIREALYANDQKVKQLLESGIEVEESSEYYTFPSIKDDFNNPDQVILQVADSKQDAKDHLKQLKRMLKDTEEVAGNQGILNGLFWINLAVLIIAIIALIVSILLAIGSAGATTPIVVAAIVLLLDLIGKIIGDGLSGNNRNRAKRLEQEMKDKEKRLGTT